MLAHLASLSLIAFAPQVPGDALNHVKETAAQITTLISPLDILVILLLFVVAYFVIKAISFVLTTLAARLTRQRTLLLQLLAVLRIGLWVLVVYIVVAGILQPTRESLIALWATAGVGIGLAAQDVLKNIFGGFVILLDRPFQVGDLIDVGPHHGEVLSIGLRATRVRTQDDTVVTVPNGEIVRQPVRNANSGALDCMVVTELYLPAFVDPRQVRRIVYEAAATSPYVYTRKPIVVQVLDDFKGQRIVTRIVAKAYVYDHRLEPRLNADITARAKQGFIEAGLLSDEDMDSLRRATAGGSGPQAPRVPA
jgi:small-conductance mechanosensitive channel